MADLYVDGAALARARADLTHIHDILSRPGRELESLDATAVGVAGLSARLAEFGDEWAYGIKQLGKFAGAAAQALTDIERSFAEVDNALGQVFRGPPS